MIYFVRRSFEADNNKIIHKQKLRGCVDSVLKNAFAERGMVYDKQQLGFNEYGKPYLREYPDVHYNISHCEGMAVCTVSDFETGIDVENIRSWHPRVVSRVFSDKEKAGLDSSENKNEFFFRIWTLKESFVKAVGIGVSYPMKSCEFLFENDRITVNGCDGYSFSQFILNDKFVCSLCTKKYTEYNGLYRLNKAEETFVLKV